VSFSIQSAKSNWQTVFADLDRPRLVRMQPQVLMLVYWNINILAGHLHWMQAEWSRENKMNFSPLAQCMIRAIAAFV